MTPQLQHRLVLSAANALVVASCAWFGWQDARALGRRQNTVKPVVALSSTAYAPVGRDAPAVTTETWGAPAPQRRGKDWIYEVFTPPEIFYDPRTKQFSITPPLPEPAATATLESAPPAPFGLELVSVKRTPFRLQLLGYAGGEGTYRGLFENTLTSETFLATRGRKLPGLGLTIEDFEVRRQPVTLADSMTTSRLVATAVLRDERTGEKVTVTDRERVYLAAPIATVTMTDGTPPREVREGDRIEGDSMSFRVDKIQLAPASVDVTKVGADQLSEQRTLTVPSTVVAAPAAPGQ